MEVRRHGVRAGGPGRSPASWTRARRGFTLIEVLVVLVLVAVMATLGVIGLRGILDVERTAAAKNLAVSWTYLRDEAAMRNVTFRVAFDFDQNSYTVEVGDPDTLVFGSPEEREAFDDQIEDELKRYTQREIEEGGAEEVLEKRGTFEGLIDPALEGPVKLPEGTVFGWVWTPQYGEPMTGERDARDEEDAPNVAYAYIFPNGLTEHTMVRLVDAEAPEDGVTLEFEPLSGRVILHDEDLDPGDVTSWLPTEGPELTL